MNIGNLIKKCISLVMVIAVLMGLSAPASAATAEVLSDSSIGYVALGDAITAGLGLYEDDTRYYEIVADYLGTDFIQKSGKLWRVEELRYLLDDDYEGDGYTDSISGLGALKKSGEVKDYVKNADVVSVQIGVNNFATYFVKQLMNYLDPTKTPYAYDFDQIAEELFDSQDKFTPEEITSAVGTVREAVMEQLLAAAPDEGDIALEFIEYAVEVATYALLSYVTSFNGMVNAIYELNPDVELYVIGIYNPAAGEVLTYKTEDHIVSGTLIEGQEIEIPVGDAIGAVIELANSYAQILAPRAYNYTYVDPGTPIKLIDKMADKTLPLDERIPVAVKNALLDASENTAVTLIQELFAEYGIEKTYKEALEIAQEIVNCKTDVLRDEYIMTTVNDLVVEEAVKLFHEKMKEYIGDFGTVPVTDQQIADLLADLTDARDNGEDERAIAQAFVDDLVTDPDVIKMAAANKIYDYVVEYGLSDFVTVENVADLMAVLDDPDDDDDATNDTANRRAAVHAWMNELAVSFIVEYVTAYNTAYTAKMAQDMLAEMESKSSDAEKKQVAIDTLAEDAFAPVVKAKFEDKGYALQGYSGDYVAFTKAVFNDSGMSVFRTELNAAAAAKYADEFAGGDATFAAELVGMLNALQDVPASGRSAAFDSWVSTITSGNESVYKFLKTSLLDLYETEYLPAATAVENTFAAYKTGVDKAVDSLTQYVSMKDSVAETILSEYEAALEANNGNPLFGDYGYVADPAVVDKAVDGIMEGFDMYYHAIEQCYNSCDALTEKFDKVFEMLAKIAEVEEICLNDLLAVAKKYAVNGTSYVESMIGNLMQGDSLANADTTVAYLALAYYFGDGMLHLPSEEGHAIVAQQIIKGIKGEPTNSTAGWLANLVIDKLIDIYHMPASASGQATPLVNPDSYAAFGDNITLGSGTAVGADETYVKLLAEALAMCDCEDAAHEDCCIDDVVLNLSLGGMRTEELLAIVDGSYTGDAYTDARFDIAALREQYLTQVGKLDLVTINVGINNLVTYPLTQSLLAYNGETPYEMDWERYLGETITNKLTSGKDAVMALLMHIVHDDSTCETTLNTVATAVEAIAYSLVGYVVNLDCAVEEIYNDNPNATIVMTEFYNPLLDTYFTTPETITLKNVLTGGEKSVELKSYNIDVSLIADSMVNLANRFLTGYIGYYQDGVVARGENSRIVTVAINETPLDIDDSVSKDLADLVEVTTINVLNRDVTIKVPAYLKEAVATGGVALHPSAEGHQYICDQILNALEYEITPDILVDGAEKYYGDEDPAFEYHWHNVSSLINLDEYSVVISHNGHNVDNWKEYVGVYDLTITATHKTTGEVVKYNLCDLDEHFKGMFHINARPITIDVYANGETSVDLLVGDTMPEFSYKVTDYKGNDITDKVSVTVDSSSVNMNAEGEYTVTATVSDKNYKVEDVNNATVKVTEDEPEKIQIVIDVNSENMVAMNKLPEFSATVTGTDASLDLEFVVVDADGNVVTKVEEAGEYYITVSQDCLDALSETYIVTVNDGILTVSDYVCWNTRTGVYYQIVHLAALEAQEGDTVQMLKDSDQTALTDVYHYAGSVNLINGITLDLQWHTLTLDSLVASAGNYVTADYETSKGVGGRLVVPAENFVVAEALNSKDIRYDLPVWVEEEGCYVFGQIGIIDNKGDRKLTVDLDKDELYFQFNHGATTYINQTFLKDGADDNRLSVEVYMQWETEDGIAYQTYVYNPDLVGTATGAYDYTFTLKGISALELDAEQLSTLTVTAKFIADCGATAYGSVFGADGVIESTVTGGSTENVKYEFVSSEGYVCENLRTGKQYAIVHEAVLEAEPDDVIVMIADSDQTLLTSVCPSAGMVSLINGVTLDLQSYVLKLDFLFVAEGNYITADYETGKNAGGRLVVPAENFVVAEALNSKDIRYDLPVWVEEEGCYVFGQIGIIDNKGDRKLTVDLDKDELYFQFNHGATTYINQTFLKDGADDNRLSVEVYMQWETEDGIAYQTYVYNPDLVGTATGAYDYTFTLKGISALELDAEQLSTLTVTAKFIADCGAIAYGTEFTA